MCFFFSKTHFPSGVLLAFGHEDAVRHVGGAPPTIHLAMDVGGAPGL